MATMRTREEYLEERRHVRQRMSDTKATLRPFEEEWKSKGPLLEQYGYRLRPRYQPDWKPSWIGSKTRMESCEDWYVSRRSQLIDAIRVSDGHMVYIKRVDNDNAETKIALQLYDEGIRADPENHSVPVLDVIPDDTDPSISYIVMPFLRLMNDPPFDSVGEVVDFVDQILDGLVFMHKHGIAHRDCTVKNLMMDANALYPKGFHPVQTAYLPDTSGIAPYRVRASASVKYYFVDYDISVHIPDDGRPKLATGNLGRDRDVPELEWDEPYDPFKTDIFILGNMFKNEFCEKFFNLEFLRPLAMSMTALEPESRPSAIEARYLWHDIRSKIPPLQNLVRLHGRDEIPLLMAVLDVYALLRLGARVSAKLFVRFLGLLQIIRGVERRSD